MQDAFVSVGFSMAMRLDGRQLAAEIEQRLQGAVAERLAPGRPPPGSGGAAGGG